MSETTKHLNELYEKAYAAGRKAGLEEAAKVAANFKLQPAIKIYPTDTLQLHVNQLAITIAEAIRNLANEAKDEKGEE